MKKTKLLGMLLLLLVLLPSCLKQQPIQEISNIPSGPIVRKSFALQSSGMRYDLIASKPEQTCENDESQSIFHGECCAAKIYKGSKLLMTFQNKEKYCFLNSHLLAIDWINKDTLEIIDYTGGAADFIERHSAYNFVLWKIDKLVDYTTYSTPDNDDIVFTEIKLEKDKIQIVAECNKKSKQVNYRVRKNSWFGVNESDLPLSKTKGCPIHAILKSGTVSFAYSDNSSVLLPYRYY
ncbi:hypothetical protein [Leptospira andrefontaineae]|uniref:Uncharacterized protein n=1 Tax=Leptospira andrefontaineae TaxID=2484976 RepID=A0A4R9H6E9_9LEPT|nr:hypothetical protein [Leptospira andrefontaineae]TGK41169.1 hypothetical protein EHO65_06980 [Leptospira andrefontaineae]